MLSKLTHMVFLLDAHVENDKRKHDELSWRCDGGREKGGGKESTLLVT